MDNGGSYSRCALLLFLQLAYSSGFVPNDYFRFERLHPGTVFLFSWAHSFEQSVGCHVVRAGAIQCSPIVVGETREFENVVQCSNATPPPASDDYSFWEHRCGIQ